jgi:hypothetical protein
MSGRGTMFRPMFGTILFLFPALCLFEIAGRLASEEKSGWGWFLFAGMVVCGVSLNLWTGDVPSLRCTRCEKYPPANDLE